MVQGCSGRMKNGKKKPQVRFFWASEGILTKYRFKQHVIYSVSECMNSFSHSFAFCLVSLKLGYFSPHFCKKIDFEAR